MIDLLTLVLTHGLIALALWRLLTRDELDAEDAGTGPRRPWLKDKDKGEQAEPGTGDA